MKRSLYLLLMAAVSVAGMNVSFAATPAIEAQRESALNKYFSKKRVHHEYTKAEVAERQSKRIARSRDTVNEWTAVSAALAKTDLKKTNPAAYERVMRALARSENRLSKLRNMKAGIRTHQGRHHKHKNEGYHRSKKSDAKKADDKKNESKKGAAKAAPAKKQTMMERLFGTAA